MSAPKVDRISSSFVCQLIDEALDGEYVVVGSHAAPEASDNPGGLFPIELDAKIGNVVGHVGAGVDAIGIHSFLEGGGHPPRQHGRARHAMLPADDAIALEPSPKSVVVGGTVDVVAYVLFASPDDFDWPVDVPRDPRSAIGHVRLQPSAEASTNQMIVDGHLTLEEFGGLRHGRAYALHHLRPDPHLSKNRYHMHSAVQRLHGGVREQRQLEGGADDVTRGSATGSECTSHVTDFLRHGPLSEAGLAQPRPDQLGRHLG